MARGKGGGPPRRSFPRFEKRLQLSSVRRTPPGPRGFRNFVRPPVAPGPLTGSAPARNPHPAPTAARARPPPGSARVYLRLRSRRWLRRRRPHCRSLGPRHAAAKFPNMDSFVRFEVFRGPLGRRLCCLGRVAAADPGCAAPRGLRHRCSPSPHLVWPPPSPLRASSSPSPPAPLLSTQPRHHRSARYGDASGGGGGGTLRAFSTRLLWPCVHGCSAQPDRKGALANHRLRQRNVTGGVTSRGLRARGRMVASGPGFWETSSEPQLSSQASGPAHAPCVARWSPPCFGGCTG